MNPALRHGGPFPDWEGLLRYVAERMGAESFLFVLDEFPYLPAAAPALPSILPSLRDHEWPGTRMKLVLSGARITAMRQLEGRFHAPLPRSECASSRGKSSASPTAIIGGDPGQSMLY
jgi:hypothetical protein